MAGRDGYIAYLLDLLAPVGPVLARRMFGGHGLYLHGVMFALVTGEALYFKVDECNRARHEAAGMGPFRYGKNRARALKTYYEVPDELLEDGDGLCLWARAAVAAALGAQAAKQASKPGRRAQKP